MLLNYLNDLGHRNLPKRQSALLFELLENVAHFADLKDEQMRTLAANLRTKILKMKLVESKKMSELETVLQTNANL